VKKTTISHIKFELLGSILGLSRWETVGILETLWQFCQFHAYDGDLSKFGPHMIAAWFGWKSEPLRLIDALVASKWIDRIDDRLIVHDWNDHAPNWVKGALKTTLSKHSANAEQMLSGTLSDPLLGKGKVWKGSIVSQRASNPTTIANTTFDAWWEVYPRKVARKAGEKAYFKAISDICQSERVETATAAVLLLLWTKERLQGLLSTEVKFRPHPATWLNGGRYRDHVTDAKEEQPSLPQPFKQPGVKP
jgi:hypothetical protein